MLGERFGKWPWDIYDEPADHVLRFLNVMAAEGEARELLYGLPDDERLINMDE